MADGMKSERERAEEREREVGRERVAGRESRDRRYLQRAITETPLITEGVEGDNPGAPQISESKHLNKA